MKVTSKFLTADVRITGVRWIGRSLRVEGLVKDLLPMSVDIDLRDLRLMGALVLRAGADRLTAKLRALHQRAAIYERP